MKILGTYLATLMEQREGRQNLFALFRFLLLLLVLIIVYSVVFHLLMVREGRDFSWLTGFYWTMTVMSTLGFGDITFGSDLGRLFSILVLLSGIVLLLIVMPFMFIRLFYAPWLDAQLRVRAPRAVPSGMAGHVIICAWDAIVPALIAKLKSHGIPYFAIEADTEKAARMHLDGIRVVQGHVDSRQTYEALRVEHARFVLANSDDPNNTNITLTVREVAPDTPVLALASMEDSRDILTLSGASHVLSLKVNLGEQLANRVNTSKVEAHVIGAFHEQTIAEFPVQNTPFSGLTIQEARLRQETGVSIIGVWEGGHLLPVRPDLLLTEMSVPIVIGTRPQIDALNQLLVSYAVPDCPVIVIGGGSVGQAATRALRRKGISVHLIEANPAAYPGLEKVPDRLFTGDAANLDVLMEAGLEKTPSVLLTMHDDALNIFIAVYCRRLKPEVRIVSRVTHERNIEAILRAGANFVLSEAWLGAEIIMAQIMGREMIILGDGVELMTLPLPAALAGRTLATSGIGARTGLSVVAIEQDGELVTNPAANMPLKQGCLLVAMGSTVHRLAFDLAYPSHTG